MAAADQHELEERLLAGDDRGRAQSVSPGPEGSGVGWHSRELFPAFTPSFKRELQTDLNFRFTEAEAKKMKGFESLDYQLVQNKIYKEHLESRPDESEITRWAMFMLIGAAAGVLWFGMHQTVDLLNEVKFSVVETLVQRASLAGAYWWYLIYSMTSIAIASSLVVLVQPAASGGGVPEVMGYLNGVLIPKVLDGRTLWVKLVSCALSVVAGLPCGSEGPMIHMGAILGARLSQTKRKIFGFSLGKASFRNPEDKREFIAGGSGAGVSAAFGAPLGGVLFVMEELSSFWTLRLMWMILFGTMLATFSASLLGNSFKAWRPNGAFGLFDTSNNVLFEVENTVSISVFILPPTVLIGCVGGVLGTLFTWLNVKLNRLRGRYVVPNRLLRVLEPLIVVMIYATIAFYIPTMFDCVEKPQVQSTVVEGTLVKFMCQEGEYNPMSTLIYNAGDQTIRALYSRMTSGLFSYGHLFLFLFLYFTFACYAAGMAISSGFVIPMIMIGAIFGRILGQGITDLMGKDASPWMDPGVFALIGSASFFSGVSRLTISLTVIILEISNDIHLVFPIMLAIMVAKWVADYTTHSLYHSMLEVKCVPFLEATPQFKKLDCFSAGDIMVAPVACVEQRCSVRKIISLLEGTTHNGFPVITRRDGLFRGFILRWQLYAIVNAPHTFELTPARTSRRVPRLDYKELEEQWNTPEAVSHTVPTYDDAKLDMFVNLTPYMDTSTFTLPLSFSLSHTYNIFRSTGLRHLVVVDVHNRVAGIITRKDLIDQSIEARLHQIETGHMNRYAESSDEEKEA